MNWGHWGAGLVEAAIIAKVILVGDALALARTVVMIVTFVPFFALWEIGRVLGHGKLAGLFFHHRAPADLS